MKGFGNKRGFTLIELLVVVAVILTLMGLVIGAAGPVREYASKTRTLAEIAAIDTALESFNQDNGTYPIITSISVTGSVYNGEPANYQDASEELFQWLAKGRADAEAKGQGVVTSWKEATPGGYTIYYNPKRSQVGDPTGNSYFQDPYQNPYGYYFDVDDTDTGLDERPLFNKVTPDIWSTHDETETPADLQDSIYLRWFTNWGSSS